MTLLLVQLLVQVVDAKGSSILLGPLARENRGLEELFARILLEEGLMGNRAGKIVHHEVHDGLDLLLGVTGVERQRLILYMVSKKVDTRF